MKIVVLVKEVPDTWGERALDLESGLADRNASDKVLDEIGERALEAALRIADTTPDTEIIALSMGPESASASLRKALALGVDRAVHVMDDSLRGADYSLTAQVLSAAAQRIGFDVIISGNVSTDGVGGVLPSMIAERLGVAALTSLGTLEISDSRVSGRRPLEAGTMTVSAALPAVVSVTEAMPGVRMAGFRGIMGAKKKPLQTMDAAELGVEIDDENVSRSIIISIATRPPRSAGTKISDSGDGGRQLAHYLIAQRLA